MKSVLTGCKVNGLESHSEVETILPPREHEIIAATFTFMQSFIVLSFNLRNISSTTSYTSLFEVVKDCQQLEK